MQGEGVVSCIQRGPAVCRGHENAMMTYSSRSIYRCLYKIKMVQPLDKLPSSGSARNRGVEGCIQDHLGLLTRIVLTKVPQELKEPDVTRQVELTHAPKHLQVRGGVLNVEIRH